MTAGLSVGRGRLGKEEAAKIRREASSIRKRLFPAIEADARLYERVLKAYRLPRETEKERVHRSRVLQKAYETATVTPRKICEASLPLLELSRVLISKGNPNARTDAGVAALLADAAVEGGLMNIRVNLKLIRDRAFVSRMERFIKQTAERKDTLMKPILRKLEETC
jgi:formiminotetrahydrofolate cyclodeaminase